MNKFLAKTLQGDRVVWTVFLFLFIISMVEMFSASSMLVHKSGSVQGPILRHAMFYAIGFMALMIVQLVDFKYIRLLGYVGLAASWLLLLYTTFFGGVEQAGAARWISIGGFQFQPSEVAKLSLIVVVADMIERMQNEERQNKLFWYVIGVIVITCGMIFTENFSTAALLFVITMTMMWIGEINWKKLATVCGAVVGAVMLILFVAWIIPEDLYREYDNPVLKVFERAYTWVARIENFFVGDAEVVSRFKVTDDNFQENHAQMAIARGGFLPNGPGTSVESNYLPEAFSDFIFAIIIEELGFFIGIFVIFLYLWLLFRAGRVARQSDSLFCAILVIGVTLLIVLQAFIHVGVSVHLGPVTGQPLPLISRGGTSILVNCIYFGIIISVTKYIQHQKMVKDMSEAAVASPVEQTVDTPAVEGVEEIIEEIN